MRERGLGEAKRVIERERERESQMLLSKAALSSDPASKGGLVAWVTAAILERMRQGGLFGRGEVNGTHWGGGGFH